MKGIKRQLLRPPFAALQAAAESGPRWRSAAREAIMVAAAVAVASCAVDWAFYGRFHPEDLADTVSADGSMDSCTSMKELG